MKMQGFKFLPTSLVPSGKCVIKHILQNYIKCFIFQAHQAKPGDTTENTARAVENLEELYPVENCRFCDATFSTPSFLLSHVRKSHENDCVYCNAICSNGKHLLCSGNYVDAIW